MRGNLGDGSEGPSHNARPLRPRPLGFAEKGFATVRARIENSFVQLQAGSVKAAQHEELARAVMTAQVALPLIRPWAQVLGFAELKGEIFARIPAISGDDKPQLPLGDLEQKVAPVGAMTTNWAPIWENQLPPGKKVAPVGAMTRKGYQHPRTERSKGRFSLRTKELIVFAKLRSDWAVRRQADPRLVVPGLPVF